MPSPAYIRKLRRLCHLTQAQAAAKTGVCVSYIGKLEAGKVTGGRLLPQYIAALRALRATQKGAK